MYFYAEALTMSKLKGVFDALFAMAVTVTVLDCMDRIAALTDSLEAREKQMKMLSIHDEILQKRSADMATRLEKLEK